MYVAFGNKPSKTRDPWGLFFSGCTGRVRRPTPQEKAQIDAVIEGLRSYDHPALNRIAETLASREYFVDTTPISPTAKGAVGYTYPSRYRNRIYLNSVLFEGGWPTAYMRGADGTPFRYYLFSIMIHENAHLANPGRPDFVHQWIDSYIETLRDKLLLLLSRVEKIQHGMHSLEAVKQ